MDSVPPATIAVAPPAMIRSAPYAIACRPDEQNRFTVTADAVIGTPERFADFGRVTIEQVIGRVDHDQLFGLGKLAVVLPHVLDRTDAVRLALHEELRFRALQRVREVVPELRPGRRDPDQHRHAIVGRADFERDGRSEGEARRPQRQTRIPRRHVIERRPEIPLLTVASREASLAPANATEVEPK